MNPGNSGGPLFNLKGEVIGINSQIFSRTGSFAGISFAIPIDYAFNVIDQLKKTGKVTRGRIGVAIQNVTKDLADSLGLPKTDGAAVGTVEEDSPAAKAGLEVGDVILKIDGRTVEGSADLSRTIRSVRPGQKVTLNVWRAGKTRDLVVTVGEFKDEEATRTAAKARKEAAKPGKLGLAVTEVTAEQKKALKVTGGVSVEAVDGAALAAGIQPGDVILRVNNVDIKDVKAFNEAVAKLDAEEAGGAADPRRERHAVRDAPARGVSPKLTVLSREYCHLCDEMAAAARGPARPLRLPGRGGGRRPPPRARGEMGRQGPGAARRGARDLPLLPGPRGAGCATRPDEVKCAAGTVSDTVSDTAVSQRARLACPLS